MEMKSTLIIALIVALLLSTYVTETDAQMRRFRGFRGRRRRFGLGGFGRGFLAGEMLGGFLGGGYMYPGMGMYPGFGMGMYPGFGFGMRRFGMFPGYGYGYGGFF